MKTLPSSSQSDPQPVPVPVLVRISPVAFAVFALAVVFLLYQLIGGGLVLLLFQGRITAENVAVVRVTTLLGQLLFILIPTLILARWRRLNIREYFRLKSPRIGQLVLAIVGVFALQQLLQTYLVLQDAIPLPPELRKLVDMVKTLYEQTYRTLITAHSFPEFMLVVVVVALVPAISEELLFRGLVQRSFEEKLPGVWGAVVAGLIFGIYHVNPITLVPLIALGVYFGFVVYRSDNIVVAMTAHFANNFMACIALYLGLGEDFVAVSPGSPISPSLLLANSLFFTVVFLAATYYFVVITRPARSQE